MRHLARAAIAIGVLLLGAQLIRPARTNPAEDPAQTLAAQRPMEPAVAAVLARSCGDCHTHRTTWPWYSQVAPISWLLVHDVDEGRAELNLSQWGLYPPDRQRKLLGEICEDVEKGEMPPAQYLLLHPQARVRPEDARSLCAWVQAAQREQARSNP
ncbi:MAG TPA: heme-binding domain-containing protein [Myxococcales bacterium]|jgi:hypothetical protein